ncbi:hypothetical protein DFJ58DRAFT_842346 [Suillus subalutaceus]|uniref:uncharacterized protein n=1 Tax=Suillus subalutaceus TaxID=48586 RepID=UPI001B88709A|nr:uncharacterized protein DFJ58DRAFT_842346 [Suillus subalutaceus]KAG1850850.1 hypothetical protein DFJ58DRAFT_842346 [Suillus subalutaceus]
MYLVAFFAASPPTIKAQGGSSFSSGEFLHQPSRRDKHDDLPTKQPPHAQCNRAFIIADASYPSERVLFINSDIGDTGIQRTILTLLNRSMETSTCPPTLR